MLTMAKTEITKVLELALQKQSREMRIFGALEVTIGWYGNERVDYLTLDYKGIWRCYEIKVSKADFYSKAKKTFVGHLNYYVMPEELFNIVKKDIPKHIGVKTFSHWDSRCLKCIKTAKKQEVDTAMEQTLYSSLIRCLVRDRDKLADKINGGA